MKNGLLSDIPCHFFNIGICRYGDKCRFSHIIPKCGTKEVRTQFCCPYYHHCKFGSFCKLYHYDQHQPSDIPLKRHIQTSKRYENTTSTEAEVEDGKDDVSKVATMRCGICYEATGKERKNVGLLSNCEHCFCMECLWKWRHSDMSKVQETRGATKACPNCRVKSEFVVPSRVFCVGETKEKVFKMHWKKMARRPCKRFNGNKGSCKWGSDCLWAHLDSNNDDIKSYDDNRDTILSKMKERLSDYDEVNSDTILGFISEMNLNVYSDESFG